MYCRSYLVAMPLTPPFFPPIPHRLMKCGVAFTIKDYADPALHKYCEQH